MNKFYLLLKLMVLLQAFVLCSNDSSAQVASYTFAQSAVTYTALGSGGTRQTVAEADEAAVAIALPFTFNYNGINYTSVAVSSNGFIQMGTTAVNGAGAAYVSASNSNGQIISSSTAGTFNTVAALNFDLNIITTFTVTGNRTSGSSGLTGCAGANFTAVKVRPGMGITGTGIPAGTYITAVNIAGGTITLSANAISTGTGGTLTISTGVVTTITGSSPNRIFTAQWSGVKRYNVADDIDFQVKLYETTNVIEAYYNTVTAGTASVAGTNDLAQIGLKGATNSDFNNRSTTSNWSATTAGGANTASCTLSASSKPVAGQLYQWTPPACMSSLPTALTSSSVLTTTATISWGAASPAPANGYEYFVSLSNTAPISSTPPSGSTGAGVLSANLISLTPGSTYYFWIRGNCGAGKSAWVGSGNFTTACVTTGIPYTQGFNAVTIPSCWSTSIVAVQTGTKISFVASSSNQTASPSEGADFVLYNSFSSTNGSGGSEERLIAPPLSTSGTANVEVRFDWFESGNTTYTNTTEGVTVEWSLNGSTWNSSTAFPRFVSTASTSGTWNTKIAYLPAGAGNQPILYVALKFHSAFGYNCYADKFIVQAAVPCTTPTDQPAALSLTAVTSTSLSGSFTAASPAPSGYIVMRSTSSSAPALTNGTTYTTGSSYLISGNNYTVVSNGAATSFTETGLTSSTQYYYYVFSFNGSCAGAPFILNTSPLTANTLTCTAAAATLTGTAAGSTSATINFSTITGAVSYILQYSVAGANAWIITSPAPVTSPYTLNGLAGGTAYDIRLEGPNAACGTTRTTSNAFTTPCTSLTLPVTQGFESGTTIPACWTQQFVSGTKAFSYGSTVSAAGTSPNPAAASGSNRLLFPSYSGSGSTTRFYSPPIVTTGTSSVDVQFQWYFSTDGGSGSYTTEGVQVMWSTNGSTWTNVGSLIRRYGATNGWQKQTLTLPAGAGNQPVLYVGFLFTANAGYDSYIDDIVVKATPPCNYAGTASIAAASVCASSGSTTLSATDYSVSGAGLAYQWQYSNDNFVSNIVDLPSGSNPASASTGTVSSKTYYRLRVFCTSAGYSYSNIVSFSVGSYAISTTTSATRCGIGTVTLQATATAGSTISWYTAATGGTSIGTGGSFVTPEISSTTNYYAGANDGSTSATIGPTYSGSNTNDDYVGSHGIVINTTSPNIVILSAKIPFTGKGTFTIQLQTTGGVVVSSVVTDEYTGGGSVPVTIPLNIAVTTPGTYRLLITAITGTIYDLGYISGPAFPYTGLGGAFSVTSGYWYGNTTTSSLYLFSLVVSNLCEGPRTLVAATVTPPPVLTLSTNAATICSGSSTTINVTTPASNFSTYSWSPSSGVTPGGTPAGYSVVLNPTSTTNYTLTATSATNCVNKATALITVNAAPPVTVGAAVCSGNNATISASTSCTTYGNPTLTVTGSWNSTTDATAPRPIIYIANSPTCNFDPTVIRNYVTQNFQVTVTGTYTFVMPNTTAYDGMGYIVTGPFVPGVCPGTGTWIVGDDDSGPTLFEPLMSATLTAGITYTLITTTYASSSGTVTDNFTWNITGPVGGAITTISGGTLQWYTVPSGGTSISSASPFNPVGTAGSGIATNTATGSYTFYAACSNNPTCRTATGYVIGAPGQWVGTANSNWSDVANWCGAVPTISTDASVSLGAPNMPVLNAGTGSVNNLAVNAGASLTITNATMQIAGTITANNTINASAGTVALAGGTTQTISGSSFTNRSIQNLVAANSVNVSNTVNDSMKITGALSFGNVNSKVFNSGDNVILVSNAAGTARVADITNNGVNTGNSFLGKFVVQRYIPARRAWRLMTAPVSAGAQTINQAWQEGAGGSWLNDPKPGYGTHITGGASRTTAQGFDQGPNNPSIYGYSGTAWNYLPATTGEIITNREGWMLFVRGSRAINLPLSGTGTVPDNTTLRPTGSIRFGTQPAVANAGGGFTVIGNPYPSPVNFKTINKTGVIGGVGGNAYYMWDPNLGGSSGVGAFVTFSYNLSGTYDKSIVTGTGTSSITNTGVIPSGAAFVVNLSPGGSITMAEKDKDTVVYTQPYVFRPAENTASVRASLYEIDEDGSKGIADGNLITFSESFNTAFENEDAVKVNNFQENFAVLREGNKISIERRNLLQMNDTIFYSMWNMKRKSYELEIAAGGLTLPEGSTAFLEDTYLHQKTVLDANDTTSVSFTVTTDNASSAAGRFRIVVEPSAVVPVTFTNVKAYAIRQDIMVEWTVQHELNISSYDIERSSDGIHFSIAGTCNAKGGNTTYNWLDEHAIPGDNFYRIKSKDNAGHINYSRIVKVNTGEQKPAISIYPNPVTDHLVTVSFSNMPAGSYNLNLYNASGQLVFSKQVLHIGGNAAETISFDRTLSNGAYQMEVVNAGSYRDLFQLIIQ